MSAPTTLPSPPVHLPGCFCLDCVWRRAMAIQIAAWLIAWELEGLS